MYADETIELFEWVNSVAVSPDGRWLASAGKDQAVKIWDMATGREAFSLIGHMDAVYSVAFSPNSKRLASAGSDGIVKIWDTVTGQEVFSLREQPKRVERVVFSQDGKRLAALTAARRGPNLRQWSVN